MALFVMKAKEGEGAGSTKEVVTRDQFGRLRIPVPTLEKQDEIAALLGAGTGKLKRLATDAERTISPLKERRSALITAAVTGQIDVRNS